MQSVGSDDFPDLCGLTANEVANRNSTTSLNLQEYHLDQKVDPQSEVRNIESIAFYPLHLLLNNLTPFNYSVNADETTPKAFISTFQISIKLYLLYIFYVYALNEYGSVHGDNILEIQSKHFDTWLGAHQGDALSARFDDISKAAKQHAHLYPPKYEYVILDIPVENSIAKALLLSHRESPLCRANNKQSNASECNFRGMDLALAEHLGQAKDLALQVYSHYFSIVIIDV